MGRGTTGDNLFDAALLATRIGHGLGLSKLPVVARHVRDNGIGVESCPLSNQALQFTPDVRDHPAASLIAAGVAVTLSPDDPGAMGYGVDWLTYDWAMALLAWDVDLLSLRQMCVDSIAHAALDGVERSMVEADWLARWQAWIAAMATAVRTRQFAGVAV